MMDSFRRLNLPDFFGSGSTVADILVAGPSALEPHFMLPNDNFLD